jgi:hypothetical protein
MIVMKATRGMGSFRKILITSFGQFENVPNSFQVQRRGAGAIAGSELSISSLAIRVAYLLRHDELFTVRFPRLERGATVYSKGSGSANSTRYEKFSRP